MPRSPIPPLLLSLVIALVALAVPAMAASPSLIPGMPPEVQSKRNVALSAEEYRALAEQWRGYLVQHPDCAVAEVQIGRALFYASAPQAEVRQHFARALKLDARCPEALLAAAGTIIDPGEPLVASVEEAYATGLRAAALAPAWPEPHYVLWPLAEWLGRAKDADDQLVALVTMGGIPTPTLDYCYNMLVGAEPRAIIFTNGDNDTYGCCALQAAYGLRPDVHVMNLSLLNRPENETAIFGRFADTSPLDVQERVRLRQEFVSNYTKDREPYSVKVMNAIGRRAADGSWPDPVYAAVTIPGEMLEGLPGPLRMEGILWRVVPGAKAGTPMGSESADIARTRSLFEDTYRLDSATDLTYDWTTNRTIRILMGNYAASLCRTAVEAATVGDTEAMRYGFRKGLRIADFHKNAVLYATMVDSWTVMDPGNPEIKAWRARRK